MHFPSGKLDLISRTAEKTPDDVRVLDPSVKMFGPLIQTEPDVHASLVGIRLLYGRSKWKDTWL